MATYVKTASKAGDWFLERLAAYQEMWLRNLTMLNQSLFPAAPMKTPDFSSSAEVAKANFDFLEKLLTQQKKFLDALYKAPHTEQASPTGNKAKARPATSSKTKTRSKTTTRKTRTKRSKSSPK